MKEGLIPLNLADANNGKLPLGAKDYRLGLTPENQHVARVNIAGAQVEYPIEIIDDINVGNDYFDVNRGVVVMSTVF